MKAKNTEDFIEEAKKVHGDKYDYSLVEYKNCKEKIKIICSTHGIFEQTPDAHLVGKNCHKCSGLINKTTEQFIEAANKIYNNKYDYSFVDYKNNLTKVKILCNIHGVFEQIPKNHLKNHECPYCAGNNKKTTEIFIEESIKINGDKYDYSLTEYNGSHKKIKLICKEHQLIFKINPHNHLFQNYSCPLCKNRNNRLNKIQRTIENKLNGHQLVPAFNKKACVIFDKISEKQNIHIQHAMNGGEYYISSLGYWLDGYDVTNNIVYEYDEKHHFIKGNLRDKDITRQHEIENFLKCKFIRIKD